MYLDSRDHRPAMTPKLALRVAILGGAALALFAIVFFRLWYLQVLSGEEYRAEANANRIREIKVQAPRGEIVDRNGEVLVNNRVGLAVEVTPNDLPEEEVAQDELFARLGRVLRLDEQKIERRVERQFEELPFSAATVEQDVELPVIARILENQQDFPGVEVERVFLRKYPHNELAAHIFGHVGEISPEQLEEERNRGVEPGDRIGQSGVEYVYDRFLRGENGATRVVVDALGQFQGEASIEEPVQGRQLRLAIDYEVQETGQEQIAGAQAAFVVMDVDNGEVLGLGSSPSYDPSLFTGGISTKDYERLTDEDNGAPLTNRATQSAYPTGSTWKLVTSVAALEEGLIEVTTPFADNGGEEIGGIFFPNAGGASYGSITLPDALRYSSDDYYYNLGAAADSHEDGLAIQNWAERLGFGGPTGVDLPEENGGLVPTPEWRNDLFEDDLTDRPWTVGDNVNLAIGQGDLQATPMQLAVAYAAVANGGTLLEPHLGLRIEDAAGEPIQELKNGDGRELEIADEHREAILDGLYRAANLDGGTSTTVFEGFPVEIAGKTGTAEGSGADQSWYAALAPYPDPQYVAVATFEDGGFGAETAAPAVREILAALLLGGEEQRKSAAGGDVPAQPYD